MPKTQGCMSENAKGQIMTTRHMPDLAAKLLHYTLMSIAALCMGVIAILLLDCISRIALNCGLLP